MSKLTTIEHQNLSGVAGGNRVSLIEDLVKRIGNLDLTKKQIGKLDKQVSKFEDKAAKKSVPAIAEGDFGAAPSNFFPITGD